MLDKITEIPLQAWQHVYDPVSVQIMFKTSYKGIHITLYKDEVVINDGRYYSAFANTNRLSDLFQSLIKVEEAKYQKKLDKETNAIIDKFIEAFNGK